MQSPRWSDTNPTTPSLPHPSRHTLHLGTSTLLNPQQDLDDAGEDMARLVCRVMREGQGEVGQCFVPIKPVAAGVKSVTAVMSAEMGLTWMDRDHRLSGEKDAQPGTSEWSWEKDEWAQNFDVGSRGSLRLACRVSNGADRVMGGIFMRLEHPSLQVTPILNSPKSEIKDFTRHDVESCPKTNRKRA